MGRCCRVLLALLLCLFLSACAAPPPSPAQIQVYVTECDGVRVLDNGQWVEPGAEVSFRLAVSPDCLVTGAELDSDYTLTERDGCTVLTVTNVRFPTRIDLRTEQVDPFARYLRALTYHPNGGDGESFSTSHDIRTHARPNTAQGGFSREGCTLTGWNTAPDGSGLAVGLGSRVTAPEEGLTLYAQWRPWTYPGLFTFEDIGGECTVTGYSGREDVLVIPQQLDGLPVTAIASDAFRGCTAREVILPPGLRTVEDGAFADSAIQSLTLFDDIVSIGDGAFSGCGDLSTLRINAATAPYGYSYRRESLLADKVDLLISAQGTRKMVFYGGCSMWYNLIGSEAHYAFGSDYRIVNMGLNGTVNSLVQMEIIGSFLEEGDLFIHTPELSSRHQLLTDTGMGEGDEKLWCGLEYNYDLFALVDIRGMGGVFDSLSHYLAKKQPGGSYRDVYRDTSGNAYLDETGSVPLIRTQSLGQLDDQVLLDPEFLADGLPTLAEMYRQYEQQGVRVYVSYACVDVDGLPEDQRNNVELMDGLFRQTIEAMEGPVLISTLSDYLYTRQDFYDTHYHLLSQSAYHNTALWLRDIKEQLERDGLLLQ